MLLKNDPAKLISWNFRAEEFLCNCSYSDCNFSMLYYKTLDSAQRFRSYINRSLHITSGHRCQRHNSVVRGSNNSYHMKGHAVDFYVPEAEYTVEEFAQVARLFFDVVIEYSDDGFIHCHNV